MAVETSTTIVKSERGRPSRAVVVALLTLPLLLALGYYLFLRTDYVVLYTDVRPADASVIVTELDRQGVAYQLRDNGATILVPQEAASQVRIAIAGANLPVNGLVGFELFNESDMGLTDFAQKINYQRALQGELARTIMMMDGIENARVHLAIPDRGLFRGARSEARAAVTVVPRRGRMMDEARVGGIQRLIAASVPDLAIGQVVVLDEAGRVLSGAMPLDDGMSGESEEQSAVRSYYRARVRNAVAQALPGARFDVRVLLSPGASGAAVSQQVPPEGAAPPARDFRMRIAVVTPTPLGPEEQSVAAQAARTAAALDERAGDGLTFEVGPLDTAAVPVVPAMAVEPMPAPQPAPSTTDMRALSTWWPAIAGLFALLALFLFIRAQRQPLTVEVREDLVTRLRSQLETPGEARRA